MDIEKLRTRLEIATNFMVLVGSLLLIGLILRGLGVRRDLSPAAGMKEVKEGQVFSLADQVQAQGRTRVLVLALSTQCRFCAESASFYRRLLESSSGDSRLEVVGVFSNPADEVHRTLGHWKLSFRRVLSDIDFRAAGIPATPTLLLLQPGGQIQKMWVGALHQEQEEEVLGALGVRRAHMANH